MIIIPAIVESVSTRRDKTYKVSLGTQELTPVNGVQLLELHQKICYVAIKAESFTNEEKDTLAILKTDDKSVKSHAQRLRNVFYILWQQNNEGFEDFTAFYHYRMEHVIDFYKTKIDG